MQGALSGQLSGSVQPRQVAGTLISALADPDTGVAAEATSTLTRSASQPDGEAHVPTSPPSLGCCQFNHRKAMSLGTACQGLCTVNSLKFEGCAGYELLVGESGRQHLQQVLASPAPSIRMRGLSLLASLASVAQDNVTALHKSGAESLLDHISSARE